MNTTGWAEHPVAGPIASDPSVIVAKAFRKGPLCVLFSSENHGRKMVRHVSVSRVDRNPSWEEIKEVRAAFFEPRHYVAQFLPPASEYVNVHSFCFHLWAKANGEDWE